MEFTFLTDRLGIVSTPIRCRALFGVAPSTVRGRVVDLASAWLPARALREDLLKMSEPGEMLDRVRRALAGGLLPVSSAMRRASAAPAVCDGASNQALAPKASTRQSSTPSAS